MQETYNLDVTTWKACNMQTIWISNTSVEMKAHRWMHILFFIEYLAFMGTQ